MNGEERLRLFRRKPGHEEIGPSAEEAGPFLGPHPPKKDIIPGEAFQPGERGATEDIVFLGDVTHPMVYRGAEKIARNPINNNWL